MGKLWVLMLVAGASYAADVEVVKGGQYFHRPGHLVVDEPERVTLETARKNGFAQCPECGAEPYFRSLLAGRAKEKTTVSPLRGLPVVDVVPAPIPEAVAPRPAPAFDLPADGLPVPGTGGLLKVPTFKGSGGIIAVPYPMGGYTVVEPPFTTGPAAPPASDPGSSAR